MIKKLKVLKKNTLFKTPGKVAESLEFAENGNFIRASSNWEYFEDSCSEKIGALFCAEILTKYQQTNSICADIIMDFGRLTIQNSSFQ